MKPMPTAPAADDDWLDRALRAEGREHRDDYLADDGFTARVMAVLPLPAAPPAWRKPVLAVLWGIAAIGLGLALPGVAIDAGREVLHVIATQSVSLTGMALGIVALAAASWAAAAVALAQD